MAKINSNQWQQITCAGRQKGQSLAGGVLDSDRRGTTYFQKTDAGSSVQQWQMFRFNTSYYVLRSKASGSQGYLNVAGDNVPYMANSSISDASMFWKIHPWTDGTFYFTNAANGSAWHMEVEPTSLMALSSNITAPQDGQRFSFSQLGTVNDVAFSTVIVRKLKHPILFLDSLLTYICNLGAFCYYWKHHRIAHTARKSHRDDSRGNTNLHTLPKTQRTIFWRSRGDWC